MSKHIRVAQITVPLKHTKEDVYQKALKELKCKDFQVLNSRITKQSVDARKKHDLKYSYVMEFELTDDAKIPVKNHNITSFEPVEYCPEHTGETQLQAPIVVIGAGPAGLFCAYLLAMHGLHPILLERGKCIEDRQKDVNHFWETGVLNYESNVQFGEGGAGTFSDGKLNTLVKDKFGRNKFVLETFVKFGAPEDILYVNKPHIGTDILRTVITNMREEIIRLGGEIHFSSKVTDIKFMHRKIRQIEINHTQWIDVEAIVLAIGHSARDTFYMLHERNVPMDAKSFAVGLRVEHPQTMINENQYGKKADQSLLPTAAYKLTHQAANGRGVYSFCMCPGGYVVNASSEDHMLAVNGMSYHDRGSANANSAIIVSVTPDDYPNAEHPLSGVEFQRNLEHEAWRIGQSRIPQQLFRDFENNVESTGYGSFESCTKGRCGFANLRSLFTDAMSEAFIEGMHAFGKKIEGFDRGDCILSGIESRTSSPVRIHRDDTFQSMVLGLYPCGEGAGYAGGITSAAMDGLKVAEALLKVYKD